MSGMRIRKRRLNKNRQRLWINKEDFMNVAHQWRRSSRSGELQYGPLAWICGRGSVAD